MFRVMVLVLLFACPALGAPKIWDVRIIMKKEKGIDFGSGTHILPDKVVTCNHVIEDGGKLFVVFSNWGYCEGKVIKTDETYDIAIIQLPIKLNRHCKFAKRVRIGDEVTIHGYGPGYYETSTGRVRAFARPKRGSAPDWFLIKGAISRHGDSGGGVFNDGFRGMVWGANEKDSYCVSVDRILKVLNED